MPLLWLSLAFLLGILLAAQTDLPLPAWLLLGGFCWVWLLVHWLRGRRSPVSPAAGRGILLWLPLPVPLLLLALALGASRLQSAQPDLGAPDFIASHIRLQRVYVIEGIVIHPPDERDTYTNLRVEARRLRPVEDLLFTPVSG